MSKVILTIFFMVSIWVAHGATDLFEYKNTADLRKIYQEYDANNVAPEVVELEENAMRIKTNKEYTILYRDFEVEADSEGIFVDVAGVSANSPSSKITVQIRPDKGSAPTASKELALNFDGTKRINLPVANFGKSVKCTVLFMLNQAGNQDLNMWVKAVGNLNNKAAINIIENFATYKNLGELKKNWGTFDNANPFPNATKIDNDKAQFAMLNQGYAVTFRDFKNLNITQDSQLKIDFIGDANSSNKVEFIVRQSLNTSNVCSKIIPVDGQNQSVTLELAALTEKNGFTILIFFHSPSQKMNLTIDNISIIN